MTDTDLILYKPENKSSAKNTTSTDLYSVSCNSDTICSQCGQDHNYKPTSDSAILDMISFLDTKRPKEI